MEDHRRLVPIVLPTFHGARSGLVIYKKWGFSALISKRAERIWRMLYDEKQVG